MLQAVPFAANCCKKPHGLAPRETEEQQAVRSTCDALDELSLLLDRGHELLRLPKEQRGFREQCSAERQQLLGVTWDGRPNINHGSSGIYRWT